MVVLSDAPSPIIASLDIQDQKRTTKRLRTMLRFFGIREIQRVCLACLHDVAEI
jgi:hypothetical protein